ncbi:uncharacterized protein HD556DRAFT_1430152 [Suillus plorans]|uniref:Uncharacterized protein n=1 Tax=Suillus plorans TaxID=116603 RepID=A0A9P7DQL1_9AGAM|nr:uncharacterized protein HD556DRAFT_1430152 [Suillus plorans]KAG1800733.1 hypothetical protein HD556DRAFT_1430152 [Suillus plorans]
MHNLFLGDLAHHVQRVLGIDADAQPPGEEHVRPHIPEEQQAQLDGVIDALKKGSRTGLMRFRRGYIASLALANNVTPRINLNVNSARCVERARTPKSFYVDALLEWCKTHPQVEIRCPPVLPHPITDFSTASAKTSNPAILHRGILRKTTMPSWLKRAPANFGSASHGKIKANQWRTVCLVNLTHTQLVDNYYMYYLKTAIKLFGENAMRTNNNHATQHLLECLRSFGPVHGWWAFPFERFNGIIQRTRTNRRLGGQMERSFMKSFCRGSNLRASLTHDSLPEAIADLQHIALDYFGADFRGTLHQDLSAMAFSVDGPKSPAQTTKKRIKLSPDVYSSLISRLNALDEGMQYQHYDKPAVSQYLQVEPHAVPKRSIKFKGVNLTPAWRHVGNSQVLLCPTAGSSISCAAQIQKIFLHTCPGRGSNVTDTFCVVRWYRELSDAQAALDPYQQFAAMDVRLCLDDFEPDELVVLSIDIISHFASCPTEIEGLDERCRVVLSLDRV